MIKEVSFLGTRINLNAVTLNVESEMLNIVKNVVDLLFPQV